MISCEIVVRMQRPITDYKGFEAMTAATLQAVARRCGVGWRSERATPAQSRQAPPSPDLCVCAQRIEQMDVAQNAVQDQAHPADEHPDRGL